MKEVTKGCSGCESNALRAGAHSPACLRTLGTWGPRRYGPTAPTVPYTTLAPETVAKAPYLLADDDHGVTFAQGEALVQDRHPDPAIVVKIGSVVRVHYGSASVRTVIEREYGFSF